MKWVLIVVWVSPNPFSGSGIETTSWNTLAECAAVGERAVSSFENIFDHGVASFSCDGAHGDYPECGGKEQEPC